MIRHEDGSVRFWDVSSAGIQLLYKLTTADMFGGYYRGDMSDIDADEEWPPFRKVLSELYFCISLKILLVAGLSLLRNYSLAHLDNVEKLGNVKVVGEKSRKIAELG